MIVKLLTLAILYISQPRPVIRCVVDPCDTTRLICAGWQRDELGALELWQQFTSPIDAPFPGDPTQCELFHVALFYDPYSESKVYMWWWYVDGQPVVTFREMLTMQDGGMVNI